MRVVFIYNNMKEFKLRKGVDPPKPVELIGVAYGGAGSIWPSVFIGARHTGNHYVITHFVIGWGHRKLPASPDLCNGFARTQTVFTENA